MDSSTDSVLGLKLIPVFLASSLLSIGYAYKLVLGIICEEHVIGLSKATSRSVVDGLVLQNLFFSLDIQFAIVSQVSEICVALGQIVPNLVDACFRSVKFVFKVLILPDDKGPDVVQRNDSILTSKYL